MTKKEEENNKPFRHVWIPIFGILFIVAVLSAADKSSCSQTSVSTENYNDIVAVADIPNYIEEVRCYNLETSNWTKLEHQFIMEEGDKIYEIETDGPTRINLRGPRLVETYNDLLENEAFKKLIVNLSNPKDLECEVRLFRNEKINITLYDEGYVESRNCYVDDFYYELEIRYLEDYDYREIEYSHRGRYVDKYSFGMMAEEAIKECAFEELFQN